MINILLPINMIGCAFWSLNQRRVYKELFSVLIYQLVSSVQTYNMVTVWGLMVFIFLISYTVWGDTCNNTVLKVSHLLELVEEQKQFLGELLIWRIWGKLFAKRNIRTCYLSCKKPVLYLSDRKAQVTETRFKLILNSCFSDLSDSLNSLNSVNFFSI